MLNFNVICGLSLAFVMTACGSAKFDGTSAKHNPPATPIAVSTVPAFTTTPNGTVIANPALLPQVITVPASSNVSNVPHCPLTAREVQIMQLTANQNRGTIYTDACNGAQYGTPALNNRQTIYATPGLPIYVNTNTNNTNFGTTNQPNYGTATSGRSY